MLFKEIYNDEFIFTMGIVEKGNLIGITITFNNVMSRRLYYKTNSNMFVYKGRWFKGIIEKDTGKDIYMNIDKYGYILLDGEEVFFKSISDFDRL